MMDYFDSWGIFKSNFVSVIQKEFDFILIDSEYDKKKEESIRDIAKRINQHVEHNDLLTKKSLLTYRKLNSKPVEVSLIGYNYFMFKNLGKSIIDFQGEKYTQNLIRFKDENPKYKHEADFLYNTNIELISEYLMCSPEKVKTGKIDFHHQIQKRLMFKINNK